MIDYLGMVRAFHLKYGHYISEKPAAPPENIIELREKLITEEAYEFSDASYDNLDLGINNPADIPSIADAIADLLYVTFGAALAYGIPIEEIFTEVHRSNMTKSSEKNIYGKTVKGDEFEPPKIRKLLEKYNV